MGPQALINAEEMIKAKELFGAKKQGVDVSADLELFQVHTLAVCCGVVLSLCWQLS